MLASRKTFALAAGLAAALSAVSAAQQPAPGGASASPGQTLVVGGQIAWIEKSDVAARREGVLKEIEFQVHDRVEKGQPIGYLYDEMARLTEAKAAVAAHSQGAVKRAQAQKYVAIARLARAQNLEKVRPGSVTRQEMEELQAEVAAADAAVEEAQDNQRLAQAELDLARQAVEEHVIKAPFTGYITDKMKSPGEAIQANEAVVRIGRIDMLRFHGYVPLESEALIREGDRVEIRATIEGADLPVEQKVFEGKIAGKARDIVNVGRTLGRNEVQVIAEVYQTDDPERPELSLRPGMDAEMTIFLGSAGSAQPVAATTANAAAPAR